MLLGMRSQCLGAAAAWLAAQLAQLGFSCDSGWPKESYRVVLRPGLARNRSSLVWKVCSTAGQYLGSAAECLNQHEQLEAGRRRVAHVLYS